MKKHFGNLIKLAITLGIGVGLIYWFIGQMSDSDKQHVVEDINRANYFWAFVALSVGLLSNYFRSERWRMLLRPLGHNPGFLNTFLSVQVMYFLNIFFPRLGEVSRCGILARYEKVPLDKAIGTMVLERIVDVVCLALLALFLLVSEHDQFILLYEQIATNANTTFADIIAKNQISPFVKYGVMFLAMVAFLGFVGMQIKAKGFENILADVKERVLGLIRGIISIKDVENPGLFVFYSLAIWICYLLMGFFNFRMFPETAGLGLTVAGVCLFFSGIAFSLTPGGLGLFPIFYRIVLELYGIGGSVAISLGLLAWTAQTAFVMLAGIISLGLLAILNREPALEE